LPPRPNLERVDLTLRPAPTPGEACRSGDDAPLGFNAVDVADDDFAEDFVGEAGSGDAALVAPRPFSVEASAVASGDGARRPPFDFVVDCVAAERVGDGLGLGWAFLPEGGAGRLEEVRWGGVPGTVDGVDFDPTVRSGEEGAAVAAAARGEARSGDDGATFGEGAPPWFGEEDDDDRKTERRPPLLGDGVAVTPLVLCCGTRCPDERCDGDAALAATDPSRRCCCCCCCCSTPSNKVKAS